MLTPHTQRALTIRQTLADTRQRLILSADDGGLTDITPDPGYFAPIHDFLKSLAGGLQYSGLIVTVILLGVAAAAWGLSHAAKSQRGEHFSAAAMLIVIIVAVIIRNSPGIIDWTSNIHIF